MSNKNNKSFWDEMQIKYRIETMTYTPMYYAQAGLCIILKLQDSQTRPKCPICGEIPNIHEYKKNCKIRDTKWSSGKG